MTACNKIIFKKKVNLNKKLEIFHLTFSIILFALENQENLIEFLIIFLQFF